MFQTKEMTAENGEIDAKKKEEETERQKQIIREQQETDVLNACIALWDADRIPDDAPMSIQIEASNMNDGINAFKCGKEKMTQKKKRLPVFTAIWSKKSIN
ncbi:hypothetical protein ZOSMA_23G00490 [Zostera marina]|uniref:Uncharacterized protein n=1 Tax=Zostera marina TaxID=29655 RepID=A0A0K9PJH0_ZOSMR|nr:hypothetical protein ZOSMA_23G00490 [Zostera marina]